MRYLLSSIVIRLNRAVALAMVAGPQAGLAELGDVGALPSMADYYLFHATNAALLRQIADTPGAVASYRQALDLATTEPERRFLRRKIGECKQGLHPRQV